jgi:hypothetical protein
VTPQNKATVLGDASVVGWKGVKVEPEGQRAGRGRAEAGQTMNPIAGWAADGRGRPSRGAVKAR